MIPSILESFLKISLLHKLLSDEDWKYYMMRLNGYYEGSAILLNCGVFLLFLILVFNPYVLHCSGSSYILKRYKFQELKIKTYFENLWCIMVFYQCCSCINDDAWFLLFTLIVLLNLQFSFLAAKYNFNIYLIIINCLLCRLVLIDSTNSFHRPCQP